MTAHRKISAPSRNEPRLFSPYPVTLRVNYPGIYTVISTKAYIQYEKL